LSPADTLAYLVDSVQAAGADRSAKDDGVSE